MVKSNIIRNIRFYGIFFTTLCLFVELTVFGLTKNLLLTWASGLSVWAILVVILLRAYRKEFGTNWPN